MANVAKLFQEAVKQHQSGDLAQAEQQVRRIVRLDPLHADALHLLGMIGHQRGESAVAIEYIGKAIAVNGRRAVYHANLGAAQQAGGDLSAAEQCFRRAIQLQPEYPEAHFNLAMTLAQTGRLEEAIGAYRQTLAVKPDFAEAHLNLGNLYKAQGDLAEAEASFRRSIQARPTYPVAHYNLGNTLLSRGAHHEAIACYEHAVALDPQYHDAWCNLGVVRLLCECHEQAAHAFRRAHEINLRSTSAANGLGNALAALGRIDEAGDMFRLAIELDPQFADAHNNLGKVMQTRGDLALAEAGYRRAIELNPRFANAWNNLATIHHLCGRIDDAAAGFRQALALNPKHSHAAMNLGMMLRSIGRVDEANAAFDQYLAVHPGDARAQVLKATMLSPLYESRDEIDAVRRQFEERVAALLNRGVRLDPERDEMPFVFFLHYHGMNDRELQAQLAKFYPVGDGSLQQRRSGVHPDTTGRIRIGFVSRHFSNHTIGYLMRGIIAKLSRDQFHVSVMSPVNFTDEIGLEIKAHADDSVVLPEQVVAARESILDRQFDILFYSDIGMESFTYSLAFHRLAPVQCATWGHPITTGIANIDYFISSDLIEPDDAADHYTETLVCLSGLPTFYHRPQPERAPMTRTDFGIPAECHAYLCPQSLFKMHPDFDDLLAEILRRDAQGRVILIEGTSPGWTHFLQARFQRRFPNATDRVQFVRKQKHAEFLELMRICDVMLDPLHFGGGNTTYEALALGVPIVTLPSPYMRGRVTAGCYRKMGVTDCIASTTEEYIALALKLGTDATFRQSIKSQILAANHALYDDAATLRELEQFLINAVTATKPVPRPAVTGMLSGRWR